MPYRLRDDLSFCRVDDHLIFLDIGNDRYFRLPAGMERAFLTVMGGNACRTPAELLELGILVGGPATPAISTATCSNLPTRSAMEEPSCQRGIGVAVALEVFWIVISTQRHLKTRKLKDILMTLAEYRSKWVRCSSSDSPAIADQSLLHASALFRRARQYVPIETRCLLDSIAMVRFLARRGMRAHIVFGVTGDPFAAHCWAQAGDIVLNDTVGNCHAHTPVRVI